LRLRLRGAFAFVAVRATFAIGGSYHGERRRATASRFGLTLDREGYARDAPDLGRDGLTPLGAKQLGMDFDA
jgi:hypothetical protein